MVRPRDCIVNSYRVLSYLSKDELYNLRFCEAPSLKSFPEPKSCSHFNPRFYTLNEEASFLRAAIFLFIERHKLIILPYSLYFKLTGANKKFIDDVQIMAAFLKFVLKSSLNHISSVADLYYVVESLAAFNLSIPVEKIRPILDRLLKQDDSVQSLGYAFHIASNFPGNIEQYYDRIEDVVVQADTVDNKYVQFEGGLSVTTLVLNGIFEISTKLGRKPDLNAEQVVGFGEYLVSRKTVRQAKSIANLLTSLEYLTTNQYFIPLVLSVSSQPVISSENRNLLVRVCDLLGNEIQVSKVKANSIVSTGDKVEVKKDIALSAEGDILIKSSMTIHTLGRTASCFTSTVSFKVVSEIAVTGVEIGIGDIDQTTALKTKSVQPHTKLEAQLELDVHQRILIRFRVQEKESGANFIPHQAFVRFFHEKSGKEAFLIAERDAKDIYKAEMVIACHCKALVGNWEVKILISITIITNIITKLIGPVGCGFRDDGEKQMVEVLILPRKALLRRGVEGSIRRSNILCIKTNVKHNFRSLSKRLAALVRDLKVVYCVIGLLFLILNLGRMRVNSKTIHFPAPIWSLGFNLCLLATFALYAWFWIQLNMFQTLYYLCFLGGATFLVGHKFLTHPSAYQS
nr:EOG090X04WQ [Artemia franciscana]